jgi:EAL domain-containing protein (putative c-di-GMP-specific phosphodiesterase class I)
MLHEACREARSWHDRCPGAGPALNVNLSARQLADPRLPSIVAAALDSSGLRPGSLVLEITESFAIDEGDPATARLEELRELGVRVAVDDFGTGYSSLSYLRNLPVDELKIDRDFIEGLAPGTREEAVVRAILAMSRSLGISAVAEGVERTEQAETLRAIGCPRAQGFLFARPVPASEVGLLLPGGAGMTPLAA